MRVLDLIRYIAQHPEKSYVVYEDRSMSLMDMINLLASIDASWYDDFRYKVNSSLEKDGIIIHKIN